MTPTEKATICPTPAVEGVAVAAEVMAGGRLNTVTEVLLDTVPPLPSLTATETLYVPKAA